MCLTPILVLEDVKYKQTRNEVSLATFTLPRHYVFLILAQHALAFNYLLVGVRSIYPCICIDSSTFL